MPAASSGGLAASEEQPTRSAANAKKNRAITAWQSARDVLDITNAKIPLLARVGGGDKRDTLVAMRACNGEPCCGLVSPSRDSEPAKNWAAFWGWAKIRGPEAERE